MLRGNGLVYCCESSAEVNHLLTRSQGSKTDVKKGRGLQAKQDNPSQGIYCDACSSHTCKVDSAHVSTLLLPIPKMLSQDLIVILCWLQARHANIVP